MAAKDVSKNGTKPAPVLKGKPQVKKASVAAKSATKAPIAKPPAVKAPAVVSKPAAPSKPVAAAPALASSLPVPPPVEAVAPSVPEIPVPAPAEPAVEKVAEAAVEAKPAIKAEVEPAKEVPAKPVEAKPALKTVKSVEKPGIPVTPLAAAEGAASKTISAIEQTFAGLFNQFRIEDKTMASTNFAGLQDVISEAQAKAQAAFEKGSSALGEVTEFTKGNVEAVMESSKIFAEGVQGLGSELVAEGRSAFETITADIKELAAVKSPTDFFKIQGDLLRKNFDSAVAYSSKNSEAVLKLVSDTIAPISGRVSVALEKARSTSL